ncbi:hypothetical protein EDD29_3381 [Actinocorallia herbida]|uniref:Uncharacterized protein n=1 Tax=Actinocorallia herbida TaxID=58109 RepID=A0A3N1CX10_9ACTN|nr:hypothetical protein [Actinocorallia herbida]ROO85832.1 hypothetical protein EDD29_3381 [Actinocorallia herbida]
MHVNITITDAGRPSEGPDSWGAGTPSAVEVLDGGPAPAGPPEQAADRDRSFGTPLLRAMDAGAAPSPN